MHARGPSSEALRNYHQFYERQLSYFADVRTLSVDTQMPRMMSYDVRKPMGEGWLDMHQFGGGLVTGRMQWVLEEPMHAQYGEYPDSVNIGVMTSGYSAFSLGNQRELRGEPGDVFVRNGAPGVCDNHVPGRCLLAGISVDVPRSMLETLLEQGVRLGNLDTRDSYQILRPSPQTAATLLTLATRMLALRTQHSLMHFLQLESLSIEFLLKVLNGCGSAHAHAPARERWAAAIDTALDIVHAEWASPLTISQLARRAGINECYLKSLFRERTGSGVATYIRRIRMEHARAMIAEGCHSVQHVAAFCGYVNASKFAQAYRRQYGSNPSSGHC